ncbi:hydantoinase/oxoprolinase [Rhizodiscina lignyota]|uniref:Hydantoinase/oxoprolinase n=1 Tax=Rhizodiscina lignyota TaxID=1504668 RepID=A0A9P4M1K8_9PEZI|nr:hydantoinase/oxoprolinase [Rhizodiscina lignyota]
MADLNGAVSAIRIGVDVGGTNTDAVALDVSKQAEKDRGVIAHFKTPTTPDVTSGIETAVQTVISTSGLSSDQIASVTIGTTHFINSVLERDARRLTRVAIIRLSKSFLREIPPFSEFPPALTRIISGYCGYVDGGLHIDGSQEAPLVESQVVEQCRIIKEKGLTAIVVAGVYSPIDEVFQQENKVREIVLRELPGVDVVCSHEVANIGFMERENASILNAAILKYARRTVKSFKVALQKLKLTCPLFITQNDGTLLDSASAAKVPIKTFSSGATNSMRGAAYLSGINSEGSSSIVIDIGGTTSDVGVLLPSGLPRAASYFATVAGVRVNYSMPHLHSIGLGGGSLVRDHDGKITVGPDSVGHYLSTEAMVFGGQKMTATDISVAAGSSEIGDSSKVQTIQSEIVDKAQACIKTLLEGAIDVIKTAPDPLPVILVGGGSILAPATLAGASKVITPQFHDVANAIGAAVSRVGGTVDIVQNTVHQTVAQATQYAKELAIKRAISAGAVPDTITIAEVESIPLQYVANQVRTIVKAVGELDFTKKLSELDMNGDYDEDVAPEDVKSDFIDIPETKAVDPRTYKPSIITNSDGVPEWHISETDLDYLADGCYILGCAGGGSPAATRIQLRDQLRAGYKMRIIDQSSLKDDDIVYWGGHMGSPATSVERLNALETIYAFEVLMEYLNHKSFDAVMGLEIGGANGLEPLLVGSTKFFDRPVIDGDWMGRAYPTYWQTTLAVHCPNELVPCSIDSGDGKSILMVRTSNDEIVDRALRASCAEMGSRVGMAAKPTTTEKVRKFGVLNTCSLAWRVGRCLALARATNTIATVAEQIVAEAGGDKSAKILFRGKITAVERRLFKGHSYGEVHIASAPADDPEAPKNQMPSVATGGVLKIPFKNENILAIHEAEDGTVRNIAMVPDLIEVIDAATGKGIGVPEFKYGLLVIVIGITCSPRWVETKAGLEIGGPRAFGHDVDYVPLGDYVEPRSVIEEYRN